MILTKQNIDKIDIDSIINHLINSKKLNEILFIVPTRRKIRYLTRELISISPDKSAAGLKIETIGSFSQNLMSHSFVEKNLISEETAVLILNQCFKETSLKYFSQYKTQIPFGTLERVKNVISEYKRHGISPRRLKEEAEKLTGAEKIKALDIAGVYKRFQNRLSNINLSEIGDVYLQLNGLSTDEFEKMFEITYPDANLVIINGFDEFTMPETNIINTSAEIKNLELFIVLDYFKYNPTIFSHLDSCHNRFVEKGFKEVTDLSPAREPIFVNSVREHFSLQSSQKQIVKFKNQLTVINARSREEEIELVAKQIKLLLQKNDIEPNRICVVFNLIEKYSPIIRDRLSLFGIPFNLTDRFSLSTSEPIKGIIHLLEIVENDFYYKSILRALGNYFAKIDGIDLSNLLKVSVELKIVSGYTNWLDKINESINELSSNYSDRNDNSGKIASYKQAEKEIQKIKVLLQSFDQKLQPREFTQKLLSLIFQLDFPAKILNASQDMVEKDLKALNTFLTSLKELTEILELESEREVKYDLKFYLNQLKTLTAFSRFNVTEKPGYGVQVTTLNEIRGLKFDYLFICGLNDSDLPTRFSPEVFFSGSFALEENRHQIEQRYLFYQALCAWDKGLFLTYPQFEERKELVQSSFLQDFLKLYSVQIKNEQSFSNTIFSKRELLERIGLMCDKSGETLKFPDEIDINIESISNSINIDSMRREDPFANFQYSGYLEKDIPDDLKERLNEVTKRQFSATQLETYAKCPYKFFLENILRIQTVEEPLEELEAFEFGSLIHSILFEFYSKLKKRGIVLKNCSDEDFTKAGNILFEIASQKFDELSLSSELAFYEREKLLGMDGNKRNSILYKFLQEERSNDDGYIPAFFELEFGKFKNDDTEQIPDKKEIKIADIKFRGKIDRIDLNETNKTLKVIDYKLGGTTPTIEDLKTGLSLQLPLYLFAAKELISAHFKEDFKPTGAEIFSLKYSEKDFGIKSVSLKKKGKKERVEVQIEDAEEMIKICIEMLNTYVRDISKGKFNLSLLNNRESKICRYCDFKKVCRIQDVIS
jgi:ATP-dependent helicase/nuclease subunit B